MNKFQGRATADEATGKVEPSTPYADEVEALTFGPIATGIDATLAERGKRYGEFPEHARITQNIKRAMIDSPNWSGLSDDKREALEMVAHKIGRILNGDADYHDSWHDVIGYTKLVADAIRDRVACSELK